ncbi:hypothetical protein JCM21714_3062 [Gracilibacillus boraciitolerans JCM 21714]|uniref:Uncharacterized protein n=1 Tax=Gracilibacillus boraciitolerans JCM 21714 TaxID=1298598 RepID=W4VKQ0_9BACI|nr:hypothetical protein JCM21714_3062 [Gracilibacillus boraciitolerans JCM 21714]
MHYRILKKKWMILSLALHLLMLLKEGRKIHHSNGYEGGGDEHCESSTRIAYRG